MAETAAHLVDRVLPDVPIRQWVVTAPLELRVLLLADGTFMNAFIRIVVHTIFRHLRTTAGLRGRAKAKCGAIIFIQRFSSSLGVFPHLHVIVIDGVYTRDDPDAPPVFHPISAPTELDEYRVSAAICKRIEALLHRRGLINPDAAAAHEPTPLEKWFARAVEERARLALVDEHGHVAPGRAARVKSGSTGDVAGFSIHTRVTVPKGDKDGRERLVKYCARPPFAEDQLSETRDGRIAFALSRPGRGGRTHLVLDPVRFLRRVAWTIPPPAQHRLHYAGVLAPAAKWRSEIVPTPPVVTGVRGPPEGSSPDPPSSHLGRARIDWARLLKRVYDLDALACPCGGRFRPIAAILDSGVACKILR
jgi:hypothetical protein